MNPIEKRLEWTLEENARLIDYIGELKAVENKLKEALTLARKFINDGSAWILVTHPDKKEECWYQSHLFKYIDAALALDEEKK